MHQYFHDTFGFCLWAVLAMIVLIAIVVALVVHIIKQKQRQDKLEKNVAERRNSRSDNIQN